MATENINKYEDVPCKMSADIQVSIFSVKILVCSEHFSFLSCSFIHLGCRDVGILHPIWRTSSFWRRL
jgi:hypothetical protein